MISRVVNEIATMTSPDWVVHLLGLGLSWESAGGGAGELLEEVVDGPPDIGEWMVIRDPPGIETPDWVAS